MNASLQQEFVSVMKALSENGFKPAPLSGRDGHALEEPEDVLGVGMVALNGIEPVVLSNGITYPRSIAAILRRSRQGEKGIWVIAIYGKEFVDVFENTIAPAIAKIDGVKEVRLISYDNPQKELLN